MDLVIAVIFAIMTAGAVPFSAGRILAEINLPLLILLFCMMTVVAGLRQSGAFNSLSRFVFARARTARQVGRNLVFLCYFGAMFITNDVALLVFVPMTITVLREAHMRGYLIFIITLQTVAANMGSMFTPVGNPQNLYLYSFFQMELGDFLFYTGATVALSCILLYGATSYIKERPVTFSAQPEEALCRSRLALLLLLFLLCLQSVLRVLSSYALACIVVPVIFLLDRRLFREVDYKLLLLFVFLFIGVGNLGQLPFMQSWPAQMLAGNEFMIALLLSQVLSNVPATVMLAPYTDQVVPLLLGVNIGGLGTIIASMASIISFKAYAGIPFSRRGRYFAVFSVVNGAMLAIILGVHWLLQAAGAI